MIGRYSIPLFVASVAKLDVCALAALTCISMYAEIHTKASHRLRPFRFLESS